jgi:hypothetical protein
MPLKIDNEPKSKLQQLLNDMRVSIDDAAESAQLPEGADFHYYKNYPEVKEKLTTWQGRIVSLLHSCEQGVHGATGVLGTQARSRH